MNKNITSIVLNNFKNDSRVLKENISFKNAGYSVQVVALHEDPLKEFDKIQGIPVHRIKLTSRSWSKNPTIQLLKYFEFVIRVIKTYRKSDILHCNDLSALPIGVLIKLFFNRRAKVVYDAHEYETEINGLKGFEKKIRKIIETFFIKYANSVITVSASIANEYQRLYGIKKPNLVLNCPIYQEQEKKNLFRESLHIRDDQTIFLYQGGLSKGRGIEIVLEAFSDLGSDKNVLVCMGYGPLESLIQSKAKESVTIFFHPAVSPEVLLNYTSSADYGILFYENTCLNHQYCSPNKMFEYLMAGLPVLTSNLYEMKRLVESEGVGVVAQDNSVKGFKQAVVDSLKQDYSQIQSNVFAARKKYCWEEQEKVLREAYGDIK